MSRRFFLFASVLVPLVTACATVGEPRAEGGRGAQQGRPAPLPHPTDAVVRSSPLPGFARGMNLGNALEAPTEGAWGVTVQTKHFELYSKAGFDHIRLPVGFSAHADRQAPYTIEETLFRRIDWAIEQALSHKMSIVIDVHHYAEIMKEPDAHKDRLVAFWKQMAERYKDRPNSVAFELLNEPSRELRPERWNALAREIIRVIRATNPTRILFVDGYFWSSARYLVELDLPTDDPNLVGAFHCYEPILFTHQGMPWMAAEFQTIGIVFPGPPPKPIQPVPAAETVDWVRTWFRGYNTEPVETNPGGPRKVLDQFDRATAFVQKTGLRVYLSEFGSADRADMSSRVLYTRYVREEAERRGIGWAYWDDGGHFKAIDMHTGAWVEPLREALLD